jgi:hypothetical protein
MINCNDCGASQLEGTLFCTECGANLIEETATSTFIPTTTLPFKRSTPPAASPPISEEKTALKAGEKRLVLVLPSSRRRLVLPLKEELYVGRAEPEVETTSFLDLTNDGAAEAGVSRRHAVIQLTEAGVVLRDLDSTNGTLLNNQILEPEVPYLLRSGDEVHFGELLVHILFD